MDMVSCVISNVLFGISYVAHAYSIVHAGTRPVPPIGRPTVRGERETRQPIHVHASSRNRLSSETSEMETRLMSRTARV